VLLGAVLLIKIEIMYKLPVDYTKLHYTDRKKVRLQYIEEQKGLCYYCGASLNYYKLQNKYYEFRK